MSLVGEGVTKKESCMDELNYVKPKRIWLREHPILGERWVQDRIAEDPSIMGLGDLVLKDKERIHPKAGRLDLHFQDIESNRRYEVEIQLGRTDESHLIRTIEYWDIERKRYPQYDHCAVIIAEDITSRFLNVIGLFNGFIPLIAIQMNAIRVGDAVSLMFATVLGELTLGPVDDEEEQEVTDRSYWEKRGTKATVGMADDLLEIIKGFDPHLELKYNKFYIGLAKDGQPTNFAVFRPQKKDLRFELRLNRSEEIEAELDDAGLDVMDYDQRRGRYRIRLAKGDSKKHSEVLTNVLRSAYDNSGG
jgi:predicted transport protein